MADKVYRLTFQKDDGTEQSVEFTAPQGEKGDAGDRGTGILKITTAPSNYTTAIGSYTPKYRIATATVISQSGVSEVKVGDILQYSYYQYAVDHLDSTYAYISKTRTSIRGATGAAGAAGADGVGIASIEQTTTSSADGGSNVFTVTLDDGATATFTVKNGSKGSTGASGSNGADGKSAYAYAQDGGYTGTEEEFSSKLAYLLGASLIGYVDANNTIVVKGILSDGTYTVKYEMEDGSVLEIGKMVLGVEEVYYSVSNNLTGCVSNNSVASIVEGGSYSAKITANDGYEISSVKVTMGGTDITATAVSGGDINIASVTGNIVITAVATEVVVEVTYQQCEYIQNSDQSSYVDLGVVNTESTGVQVKFEFWKISTSQAANCGVFGNTDIACGSVGGGTDLRAYHGGVKSYQLISSIGANTEYVVGVNFENCGKSSINGTQKAWNSGTKTFKKSESLTLCKQNGNAIYAKSPFVKIKEVYISEGTTVSKHFVPAYRSTDGAIGMLETNSGEFIVATGNFTKGADV